MKWGTPAGEERRDEQRDNDGKYFRYFKDDKTTVRFLVDPKHWVGLYWHFMSGGRTLPCKGRDADCVGCANPSERIAKGSKSYCAPLAVIRDDKEFILPFKIPATVKSEAEGFAEDEGVDYLLGTDFTVRRRKGDDGRVKYSLIPGEAYSLNTKKMVTKFAEEYDAENGYEAIQTLIQKAWDENVAVYEADLKGGRSDDEPRSRRASSWDDDDEPKQRSTRRNTDDDEPQRSTRTAPKDDEDDEDFPF